MYREQKDEHAFPLFFFFKLIISSWLLNKVDFLNSGDVEVNQMQVFVHLVKKKKTTHVCKISRLFSKP